MNQAMIAGGFFLLFGVFLALAQRVSQHSRWHPELWRKLIHMALGLATLSFPWVFSDTWPVLMLGGIFVFFFFAMRVIPGLRDGWGKALYSVRRSSWGEFYFAISTVLLFWLTEGDPLLFVIPMGVLAISDAMGALIGVRYGKTSFETISGEKSVEGSVIFLLVTFLVVHISLLLGTDWGRQETVLIAAMVAIAVTMIEGMSSRGIDNALIPLSVWYLLERYQWLDPYSLLWHAAVMTTLAACALILRRSTSLNGGALLGAILLGYAAMGMGGWLFFIPLVVVYGSHLMMVARLRQFQVPSHDLRAVLSVGASGLLWLGWQYYFPHDFSAALYTYCLALSFHFALMRFSATLYLQKARGQKRNAGWAALAATALAVLFCHLGFVAVPSAREGIFAHLCIVGGSILPMLLAFDFFFLRHASRYNQPLRWIVQGVGVTGFSILYFVIIR